VSFFFLLLVFGLVMVFFGLFECVPFFRFILLISEDFFQCQNVHVDDDLYYIHDGSNSKFFLMQLPFV